MKAPQALSTDIAVTLRRVDRAIASNSLEREDLLSLIGKIAALPPKLIVRAHDEISAQLYKYWSSYGGFEPSRGPALDALGKHPGLEYLYVFHQDGRVREAALKRFESGARSPFYFAAIAYRMNDWAKPVRAAAEACARRVYPQTYPAIIARAATFLLDRRFCWQRWENGPAILDQTLFREDVIEYIVDIVRVANSGAMGSLLRYALRSHLFDPFLLALVTSALLPDVRAVALQALIEGRTTWPTSFEWEWVDKAHGIQRRNAVFGSRKIERTVPLEELVAIGVRDRFVAVRRVAVQGIIQFRSQLSNLEECLNVLAGEQNKSILQRIDFLRRQEQGVTQGQKKLF